MRAPVGRYFCEGVGDLEGLRMGGGSDAVEGGAAAVEPRYG